MKNEDESFRDTIGTIKEDGNRNWIFAKRPVGKYYNWRNIVSIFYLLIFFALPWIKYQEQPLFLANLAERKFILFGVIFWPQDFFCL